MSLRWLLIGTVLITAGHCIRALRFSLLLESSDTRRRSSILFSLCLAYAVNAMLPLRAGDALRAAYLRLARPPGSRMSAARAVSAVAVERMADLAVVGPLMIALGLAWPGWIAVGLLVPLCCLPIACGHSRVLRSATWHATAPMAHGIRLFVVDCTWSVRTLLLSPVLRTASFAMLSLAMWSLYLLSYAALARATSRSMSSIVESVHGAMLHAALQVEGTEVLVLPLVVAPMALLVFLLPLRDVKLVRNASLQVARRLGAGRHEWFDSRFLEEAAYKAFLLSFFAGQDEGASRFGLAAIGGDGARVRRFMEGGSGAVTALMDTRAENGDMQSRVRKFAMGEAAPRLVAQAEWLCHASAAGMPATAVLEMRQAGGWASYDMPYLPPCSDAYDAVHAMPVADSCALLADVMVVMRERHARTLTAGNEGMMLAYAESKVAANARRASALIEAQLGSEWTLNGETFSLQDLEPFTNPDWAVRQMSRWGTQVARTHGDLTLENIVVSPSHPRGWFLIDPNPDGPFDRPLLDMGKLLQSLHLGYEGLSRLGDGVAQLGRGRLVVPIHRSEAYARLHALLVEDILCHEGEEGVREARFHEFVHYLRMIPYKARKSPLQGVAFSALAVMLGRDLSRC